MRSNSTVTVDLVKGAMAGAVGVWVMDRVDWYMVEHGNREAWRRTQAVRPHGQDPAHNIVNMAAEVIGAKPIQQPHPAGIAMHYAVGMAPAAAYSATRKHLPGGVVARGIALGLGLFLVEDEIINPLTGASAPANKYPWQAHARGLVAHLVLGVVTEAVLQVLDRPERTHTGRRSTR